MQVSLSAYFNAARLAGAAEPKKTGEAQEIPGSLATDESATTISISSLAGRLAQAASNFDDRYATLPLDELGDKVRRTIERVNYPLTGENMATKSLEAPASNDPAALASAAAANAFVAHPSGRNPFAGLSREQLSHIVNDESGTFTSNERYAAYRQAYDEEQAWRSKAVAAAMDEYHRTGKLTDFFSSALAHFNGLPTAERALYPTNYAEDLQYKIDLDFDYLTHAPGDSAGMADISFDSLRAMF